MRVLVLGGDGFVGWPLSLALSSQNFEVSIIDSLFRRKIDQELGAASLTPILSPHARCDAWTEIAGKRIDFLEINIAEDYDALRDYLVDYQPDVIIHLAEQRAAPYSMKSAYHRRLTVENNTSATHNVLCAMAELELDAHLVHIGTMGVYGYGASGENEIPEGYLDVEVLTPDGGRQKREILHPVDPGSIYHATKCLDQTLFAFYAKNYGLRITDLHQGIIWGTNTSETGLDERLINRFDYDGDFGTVLNRFLVQATIGYPLSVYGTGGQSRAFIHIRDCIKCIQLAMETPPQRGDRVRIINQMTETHRVRDLATIVHQLTGTPIAWLKNPRKEAAENELNVSNKTLIDLGLKPTLVSNDLFEEIATVVERYRDRIDTTKIPATTAWTPEIERHLSDAENKPAPPKKVLADVVEG